MKSGTITLAQLKGKFDEAEKPVVVKQDNKKIAEEAFLKRKAQIKELGKLLNDTYPGVFDYDNPKPLAIGIDKVIAQLFPEFSHKTVRFFMLRWVKSVKYLKAMILSDERFSLNNEACGLITEQQKKIAQDFIDKKHSTKTKPKTEPILENKV